MSYRITHGDVEITKNVLTEIVKRLGDNLSAELEQYEYETDCPSYDNYQSALDTLVYVEAHKTDLTNP